MLKDEFEHALASSKSSETIAALQILDACLGSNLAVTG